MEDILFYQNYVITGDIIALALCLMVEFLVRSTYTVKRTNLSIFTIANRLVGWAAFCSIIYHTLIDHISDTTVPFIYFFRVAAFVALTWTWACYCIYIKNLVGMDDVYVKRFRVSIIGVGWIFTIIQVFAPLLKMGFYIDENFVIHQNYYYDMFHFIYIYYAIALIILVVGYHKKVFRRMLVCICSVMAISFSMMVYQLFLMQTSYTAVTFALPIITVLFLFHYNSYDAETGTLDQHSFIEFVADMKGKDFSMIFISFPEISHDMLKRIYADFLRKNDSFFKDSYCFRLRNNRIVLIYQKEKNKDYIQTLNVLFYAFQEINARDNNDYYIVLIDSSEKIDSGLGYISLYEQIQERSTLNTTVTCTEEMIDAYVRTKVVQEQLKDIFIKEDLEDERVKVYCQPVLNTEKNKFSTAEALMRLELPELGLVYPDEFIKIAERFNYIHVLSKIILNKTCKEIKVLEEQGYEIERISVNFSVQELRLDAFCQDVINIIKNNDIEFSKIAIELTETKNDKDYNNMKKIMEKLHALGMTFYLDDFGTGYSNFERIIELPVDTIKFDRSLTLLAAKNEESRFMVGSFSEIFKKANYQILFEGVEDERDESQCINMNAQYLQGYRYSRPIPIEQLKDFLSKK